MPVLPYSDGPEAVRMNVSSTLQSQAACESTSPHSSQRAFSIAERARQLEIASYLLAASVPLNKPNPTSDTPSPAALSTDPNLPALTQLGALRLDCDRAFVSLIDGSHQYIIAEATRSTSVTELGRWAPGDAIYLGVQTLDISFGVCPNTMEVFTDTTGKTAIKARNVIADRTRYIIRDFQAEPHYRDRPYVKGWPYMRSYAEVPLISPLGYVIGSYCVVDNKLRDFDDDTVFVLNEVAKTIMAHLDLMKSKQMHARSQSLMRGLAFFVEGDSSISAQDIPTSTGLIDKNKATSVLQKEAAVPTHSATCLSRENSGSSSDSWATASHTACYCNETSSSGSNPSQKCNQTPLTSPLCTTDVNPFDATSRPLTGDNRLSSLKENLVLHAETLGTSAEESIISSNVRAVFYRAAALIRQTTDMDGVIFLDACPSGFSRNNASSFPEYTDTYPKDDERQSTQPQSLCATLASSIQSKSGIGTTALSKDCLSMPEALLQRIIRRYPRGRVFSADEFGPIDEEYPPSLVQEKVRARGNADIEALFQFLPTARSIIFLPLWHFQKELWFAGAFGWTTDPIKAFNTSDITYISAFGNAVMAEVSRLEAMDISYAKSDFISSLSHELRSPLHGILASAELLRQSDDMIERSTLLDMIESCGSTLLDTMNHLLDYAKINNLASPTADQNSNVSSGNTQQTQIVLDSSNDLASLVQDVVEGVFIGHESRDVRGKFTIEHDVPMGSTVAPRPATDKGDHIGITVCIQKQPSWQLNVITGAWKRIIMNLFGNALKYTTSGHIEVGLQIVSLADTLGVNRDHVSFSVKDTGIGMSAEYLRYRLFTPFSQENGLSVGTGLGLSIVHQIVKSLGGKLDVESKIGVGTEVKVFVPLGASQVTENLSSLDPESKLKGLTLCLVDPSPLSLPDPSLKDEGVRGSEQSLAFQKCVTQIANEWLHMNVVHADNIRAAEADIFIVDGATLHSMGLNQPDALLAQPATVTELAPVVVLCERNVDGFRGIGCRNTVELHYPIGPKKLAAVLLNALTLNILRTSPPTATVLPVVQSDTAETQISLSPSGCSLVSVAAEKRSTLPLPMPQSVDRSTMLPAERHVMVVDDNIVNSKILTTFVKRLGCSYVVASDGLQAVEAYKASTKPFDIVFMDMSMPIMNGFAATREIRSYEQSAQLAPTQVVALTGLGSAASQKEALASGVDIYMIKPVSLKDVRKLLLGEVWV